MTCPAPPEHLHPADLPHVDRDSICRSAATSPHPMNTKQLAQTWFDELWNKKNAAIIEEMMDPAAAGVSEGGAIVGPANFKQMVFDPLTQAFPDLRLTIDGVIAEGDQAAVRWTVSGTHRGPMIHLKATGKRVRFSGMTWLEFKNGKLVAGADSFNLHGLLAALAEGTECGSIRLDRQDAPESAVTTPAAGPRPTPEPLAVVTGAANR